MWPFGKPFLRKSSGEPATKYALTEGQILALMAAMFLFGALANSCFE